ncbi:hypothetical protein LTR84_007585 [Exophiala bonariae]|uniref:UBA domain-containing protein n=1 Tax=Exophiala bonariae TaxID=1690606 RepID=A0AAV9NKK9_9EURO|nr:hypothetical protein LTR84_007585 [Exophiala bonariae]
MADCNSPKRPSSPLLPAFGIRNLNGPEAPPGLIQITGGQYKTTIKSQPDATLRYFDDDDGDVITVGSSLELRERLDDPVRRSSRSFRSTLSENQMMHIFDIQKSAGSLAVWRDHEAYSSKSLREDSASKDDTTVSSVSAPVSPISLEFCPPPIPSHLKSEASVLDDSEQQPPPAGRKAAGHVSLPHEHLTVQLDKVLDDVFGGIQTQLGPLADFLDTAADGLRKAAEKTAESDTTAVENVLTGFMGIWSELGQMGREFLESIDEQIPKENETKDNTSIIPKSADATQFPPQQESNASPRTETASKRVSFTESPAIPVGCHSYTAPPTHHDAKSTLGPLPSYNAVVQKPMLLPTKPPFEKAPFRQSLSGNSTKHSILDWETSDPDFSTRYPPLLSLRKAKSVSGIHGRGQFPSSSGDSLPAGSALSRFPSINQLEQQSRSQGKPQDASLKQGNASSSGSTGSTPKSTTYKKPAVEDTRTADPLDASPREISVKQLNLPRPSWSPKSLPGSWPEPKGGDAQSSQCHISTKPMSLPSRHIQIAETNDDAFVHPLPGRLSSPVSETYSRAPIFPRRHQTVSSANPAARLNGPFDPLANFPALQPRPQRSQPDLKLPHNIGNNRPTFEPGQIHIPGAFPQRSRTVHHTERYKPHPGFNYPNNYPSPLVYGPNYRSYASNVAPSLSPLPRLDTTRPDFHRQTPPQTTSDVANNHMFNPALQRPTRSDTQPQPLVAERSEPNLSDFIARPPPTNVTMPTTRSPYFRAPPVEQMASATTAVKECIHTLRSMGYGNDAHELARLNVYAGAAAGNIEDAIEMIEEDREAVKELDDSKNLEQIRDMEV